MKIRKLVKISIWSAVGLVVLVVGAGVVLYMNLNSIVRRVIETQATSSLNLATKLSAVDVGLFGGNLKMTQLQIGSPNGFKALELFDLSQGSVSVTYGEMRKQPIHIKQIVLDRPKIVVEMSNLKFNIQAAMDGLPKSEPSNQPPMKLIIDELQVNNATVSFLPGLPGLSSEMKIPIPSLTLKNLGNADGAQNGEAISKVAMMAITAIAGKAAEAGGLPSDLNKAMSGMLANVSGQLGAEFDKQFRGMASTLTKDLPSQAGKAVAGATKDLQKGIDKGLGDVLGGKKK
jgi:uncharacterized protein involved in outer membrane biogenesis